MRSKSFASVRITERIVLPNGLRLTPEEIVERSMWDVSWVPSDSVVVDRPEIKYISTLRDITYLNMVVRTRAGDAQLPALIDEVRHAHRLTSSRWLVPSTIKSEPLVGLLEAHGYALEHGYGCFVRAALEEATKLRASVRVARVMTLDELKAARELRAQVFNEGLDADEDKLRRDLEQCTRPDATSAQFLAYVDAAAYPVATGGIKVLREFALGMCYGGCTLPEHRGRGAYSALIAARLAFTASLGASLVGVYARNDTSAPIVERNGFVRCGEMLHYDRLKRAPDNHAVA